MKVFFIYNPFTKHPKSVNETYFQHMRCAFTFFYTLLGLSLAALVHSVFPFWFEHTASNGIKELNDCMKKRNTPTTNTYGETTNTYGDDDWATPGG